MDENKQNNNPEHGFISGFDSFSNINDPQNEKPESDSKTAANTADNGQNISNKQPEPENAGPVAEKQPKVSPSFIPNGTYSYSAAKGNIPESEPVITQPQVQQQQFANNPGQKFNGFVQPGTGSFNNQRPVYTKPEKKAKKPKKYGAGVIAASVIIAAVLGLGGGFGGAFLAAKTIKTDSSATTSSASPTTITNITVDETVNSTVEAVAKKAESSIVGIRSTAAVINFIRGTSKTVEEGSGIVYSADGYIITNYHVIQSAVETSNSKVEVFFANDSKTAVEANIVGYNISSDLAVVKVKKTELIPFEFADSDKLNVGQTVVAIGNPGGLEFMGSVSSGVISGLNRSVTVDTGNTMSLIQTDAAINPGNSGGALVNATGQLIGVNSVKLVDERFEGMGFAIPSNTVKSICDKIIAKQGTPTPYIGIQISQNYTAEQLKKLGYPEGAIVVSVTEDGPAADSGIQRGDIITEFNGKTISNYTDLDDAISSCKPGDSVTVKLYRSGRFYSTNVNVEANNAQ